MRGDYIEYDPYTWESTHEVLLIIPKSMDMLINKIYEELSKILDMEKLAERRWTLRETPEMSDGMCSRSEANYCCQGSNQEGSRADSKDHPSKHGEAPRTQENYPGHHRPRKVFAAG